jgi:hypothetical protein
MTLALTSAFPSITREQAAVADPRSALTSCTRETDYSEPNNGQLATDNGQTQL